MLRGSRDDAMATIESWLTFSETIRSSAVPAATAELSTSPKFDRASCAEQWTSCVENKLTAWDKGAGQRDEDGLVAPARTIVSIASQVAAKLRDAGVPIPLRMVQDGAGGIVFEWRHGATSDKLRLDANGCIEATGFFDSKLVYRRPISLR